MGPLTRSESNPNYFARPDGTPIYFVGSHHWSNLQDQGMTTPPAAFNYTSYINWMQSNRFNFMRMWNIAEQPYSAAFRSFWYNALLPYTRPGPGVAADGKLKFDINTLIKPISTGFERGHCSRAARCILELLYSLMDGVSKRKAARNPWKYHPSIRRTTLTVSTATPRTPEADLQSRRRASPPQHWNAASLRSQGHRHRGRS